MTESARLKIWRGTDAKRAAGKPMRCRLSAGQSVLDGLRWIRANRDPTLAIRFSCINANACKECMIELDGKTVYACTARLQPREMTVAPLSNKKLVRDLVTEIAPPSSASRTNSCPRTSCSTKMTMLCAPFWPGSAHVVPFGPIWSLAWSRPT